MNKILLSAALSLLLCSTSAMALTININKKKSAPEHVAPPPPPPPPPPAPGPANPPPPPPPGHHHAAPPPPPPAIHCDFVEPRCDRHDKIHPDRYRNEQIKFSRGECFHGEKERRYDFYCSNGEVWMTVDYRRDRPGRVDCRDPRTGRMFAARDIRDCERFYRH